MHVKEFLVAFDRWARVRSDIQAIGLVGSHARDVATEDSDIDLLILTTQREPYFRDQTWALLFGEIERSRVEDWGMVESLRIHYSHGLEVEYGFSTPEWVRTPIDDGTLRVVAAGMRILYDPRDFLGGVQRMAMQRQ